jgi:hypothetical protein
MKPANASLAILYDCILIYRNASVRWAGPCRFRTSGCCKAVDDHDRSSGFSFTVDEHDTVDQVLHFALPFHFRQPLKKEAFETGRSNDRYSPLFRLLPRNDFGTVQKGRQIWRTGGSSR